MADYAIPKSGVAFIMYVGLIDQSNTKLLKANPTLASGDFKVSIDGGAFANLTTLPTVTPASGTSVKISLSAAEMTGDNIVVTCIDASGAEWCDQFINLQTAPRSVGDLAFPATSGRSMVVDASGLVDANMVKAGPTGSGTAQTAKDIGGAVPAVAAGASGGLLISGSNTGTTTLGALTVTGATTLTGAVTAAAGVAITQSTSNASGLVITGNGTGHGILATSGSGATGNGIQATAASTNGNGLSLTGTGTGNGVLATPGATGHGINAIGGATSGNGVRIAGTAGNSAALNLVGQGSAAGLLTTGGATGHGISAVGGATSGDGINSAAATSGHGITVTGVGATKHGVNATGGSTTSHGISATGGGVGHGILATSGGGATGDGIKAVAASTAGNGLNLAGVGTGAGLLTTGGGTGNGVLVVGGGTSGDGFKVTTTSGHGINLAPVGTSMHGFFATGGNGGTSDGMSLVAGTGGVPFRGNITGNITGTVSGAVGSVATGGITAASIADGAIDRATFAADTGLQSSRSNTAAAGAAGSITLDASASAVDDFYKDMVVYLTSGTGVGQGRLIKGYTGATKVALVTPNWATAPDNTSTFAIMDGGQVDVAMWAGTAVAAPNTAGTPVVDVGRVNNVATTSVTAVAANVGTAEPLNFTGTAASALVKGDVVDIAGAAVNTAAAQLGVNVVTITAGQIVIKKNTALANFEFFLRDTADGYTGKTGVTVTAQRSIDGGALAACANAVTEISGGLYKISLAAADLNGNVITLLFTGTGAVPTPITLVTQP